MVGGWLVVGQPDRERTTKQQSVPNVSGDGVFIYKRLLTSNHPHTIVEFPVDVHFRKIFHGDQLGFFRGFSIYWNLKM